MGKGRRIELGSERKGEEEKGGCERDHPLIRNQIIALCGFVISQS